MASTRLFIGGLSDRVDRQELGEKVARYAPVTSIDLKEKTDLEGNVVQRFAYVNVDGAPSQVEQCIEQLNGVSWKGSYLRVEQAKESFLDRLNRERAARKGEDNTYFGRSDYLGIKRQRPNVINTEGSLVEFREQRFSKEHSKKRKEWNTNDENCLSPEKKSLQYSEVLLPESHLVSGKKERKKKKNEVEAEILSSFKQFSSVWADSDNENEDAQGGGKFAKPGQESQRGTKAIQAVASSRVVQNDDSDATVEEDSNSIGSCTGVREEQQTQLDILEGLDDPHSGGRSAVYEKGQDMGEEHQQKRGQVAADKPTLKETMPSEPDASSKYVRVSKDLSFGQNTGFSLLAHFSRMGKEEAEKEEVAAPPVSVPRSLVTVHQKVKSRPFFICKDDREIKGLSNYFVVAVAQY
ncbi:probable RNA-binding protein CG14230 isoform X2 [Portunus trituberculatus]|nr:probable RNA-binding protein CG14230 isoform X2 [Portunus trituberculatus]XP_045104259.1 probable RNA-binding protein CG14230 isoform X2 [Portunus trituberculatus]